MSGVFEAEPPGKGRSAEPCGRLGSGSPLLLEARTLRTSCRDLSTVVRPKTDAQPGASSAASSGRPAFDTADPVRDRPLWALQRLACAAALSRRRPRRSARRTRTREVSSRLATAALDIGGRAPRPA